MTDDGNGPADGSTIVEGIPSVQALTCGHQGVLERPAMAGERIPDRPSLGVKKLRGPSFGNWPPEPETSDKMARMAMTAMVKAELSRLTVTKPCCRKAEVSATLRFAGGLHIVGGRIVVEAA